MICLLPILAAAALQAPPSSWWDQPTMIGDRGGVRPTLADAGVTTLLAFTGEVISNIDGGLKRDTGADLLLDWIIDADLNKAVGWTGGSARINPMWLAGDGITGDVGDVTIVSNITGRGGVRMFEAWLQQSLFENAFSLRAGILAADQEFVLTTAGTLYYNSVFGGPVFLTPNVRWPMYPVGAPGARARIDFTKQLYFQAAVYDGDPGREEFNRTGIRVRLGDEEGLFSIMETGLTLGETHPIILKAGAFVHSAEFEEHTSGLSKDRLHGGYVVAEHRVVPGKVDAFLRLGIAQEDRAFVSLGLDCGINLTGLIPGRPADVLGIGFIYARISGDFARAQPDRPHWGYESVIEVTYKITFAPWLSVQPDVQVILHPGGSTALPDATVVGIRIDVLF
jgi:porin